MDFWQNKRAKVAIIQPLRPSRKIQQRKTKKQKKMFVFASVGLDSQLNHAGFNNPTETNWKLPGSLAARDMMQQKRRGRLSSFTWAGKASVSLIWRWKWVSLDSLGRSQTLNGSKQTQKLEESSPGFRRVGVIVCDMKYDIFKGVV